MKRKNAEGELVCRVTNNGLESPNPNQHTLGEIKVEHSESAQQILSILFALEEDCAETCQSLDVEKLRDLLTAYKYYPPARAADGKFSACNPLLFAATESNQNLVFCTGFITARYVAKYAAKLDAQNITISNAVESDPNAIYFDVKFLHNTKVTGSKMNEMKIAKCTFSATTN